jgi:O-methyltransferase
MRECLHVSTPRGGFESVYRQACYHVGRAVHEAQMSRAQGLVGELLKTHGDSPIAECGVFTGLTATLLCSYMGASEYHGFDWFKGLEPAAEDENSNEICRPGLFAKSPLHAQKALAGQRAEIHVGHIPEVLYEQPERTYRFAHIDVDCYHPTLTALRYFWPRLETGGRMVCDDFASWKGARRASDEFGVPYSVLDTGQASWVKQ